MAALGISICKIGTAIIRYNVSAKDRPRINVSPVVMMMMVFPWSVFFISQICEFLSRMAHHDCQQGEEKRRRKTLEVS